MVNIEQSFKKWRSTIIIVAFVFFIGTALAASVFAADTTQPTIVQVTPANNQLNVATHDVLTVQFSEPMDTSTINGQTFSVVQRMPLASGATSPEYRLITGTVTYSGLTATFTPSLSQANPLQPNQQYGNVFTATVTPGARDLAGNSIARDYTWTFTTGLTPFYTGALTSQTDQSPTNLAPLAPVQVAPTPAATPDVAPLATSTTASAFPWGWVIGGLVLLALLVLLFLMFMQPAPRKVTEITTEKDTSPFGDVHPVIELEGIGPKYSKRLAAMGIHNTHQLWSADATKVAKSIDAPVSSVKSWQHMAELASVKDIGPQYAELLERSGIHTIALLKNCSPKRLLALVSRKQESLKINIQGNSLGMLTVEHWIAQARSHHYTTV